MRPLPHVVVLEGHGHIGRDRLDILRQPLALQVLTQERQSMLVMGFGLRLEFGIREPFRFSHIQICEDAECPFGKLGCGGITVLADKGLLQVHKL